MIVDIVAKEDFEQKIKNGGCLVDFWAPWCGPCRMLSSVLDDVHAALNGDLQILKVNVDNAAEVAVGFDIQSVPVLMIFKDGEMLGRKNGFVSKSALLAWLDASAVCAQLTK
jgi:thioredoxin 1